MTQDFDHDEDAREEFRHFIAICQRCQACDLAAHRQNVVV